MYCFRLRRFKSSFPFTNSFTLEFSQKTFNDRYCFTQHRILNQQVNSKIGSDMCRSIHTKIAKSTLENRADADPDLDEFNKAYDLVQSAVKFTSDKAITDAVDWAIEVLDYNTQDGKKNRGVAVLKAHKILSGVNQSSDGIVQASLLGWCVEMLQGFFLVCDDIMDNSETRRGKPCWYKKPNVGLCAINDALLLECGIYKILEMYFSKLKAYDSILHEFLKVTHKTVHGQALDMLNVPPNQKPRFENFTLEKYRAVVEYKTSHYTFCLPVHLAMHLNGNFSAKDFDATRNICLKLGLLFQIQDDHLDTFGDSEVTGKIGTDIVDGKCTWFAATVFEDAPSEMKQIMKENYGVDNPDSVSKVMKVFKDFELQRKFSECEQTLEKEINILMENTLSSDSLRKLFQFLLQKIHKRKK